MQYAHEDLLSGRVLAEHPGCTVLVLELAHLHPRVTRADAVRYEFLSSSKAQIYTVDELRVLQLLTLECGVEVRAFSQALTHRAICEELGFGKRHEHYHRAAAMGIYLHLCRHPDTLRALKRWRAPTDRTFELDRRKHEIRQASNRRLNLMRTCDYEDDPDVELCRVVLDRAWDTLSDSDQGLLHQHFDIRRLRQGPRRGLLVFNEPQTMSVFCACVDAEGRLYRNDRGGFIGVQFVQHVLKLSAFHSKGGTARSNLMYHGQRSRERAAGLGNAALPGWLEEGVTLRTDPEAHAERARIREARTVLRSNFQRAVRLLVRVLRDHTESETGAPLTTE